MKSKQFITEFIGLEEAVIKGLFSCKFPDDKASNRIAASLICTIAEQTSTVCRLINIQHNASVPMIVRNVFEAYVDLVNLLKDSDYKNVMYAEHLRQESKFLNSIKGGNIYAGRYFSSGLYREQCAKNKERTKQLDKKYFMNFYERAKLAGLEDAYNVIYRMLSTHTHNNLKALFDRHTSGISAEPVITIFKEMNEEDVKLYIVTLGDILLPAVNDYYSYAGVYPIDFNEVNALWLKIKQE